MGTVAIEYRYSGARRRHDRRIEDMLWSDPQNEPPEELRETQAMMRRVGVVLALAMVLAMFVVGLH
ncbi:hypothetical protein OID54_24140 [Streptomyces sp. NBC_00690]|nr:hypothetical protein [Streptomyces sp. NBC_00690]